MGTASISLSQIIRGLLLAGAAGALPLSAALADDTTDQNPPPDKDKKPVELHAGRYGPYVKHGDVNATVPERDQADALTLDDAVQLLAAKAAREGGPSFARAAASAPARAPAAKATKSAAKPAARTATKRATATKPATRKSTAKRKS